MDSQAKKELLDAFGKELMAHVRDRVLETGFKTLSGDMKSPPNAQIGVELSHLSDGSKEMIIHLIATTILDSLSELFYMLEEKNDQFQIIGKFSGQEYDLTKLSDGLVGEFFGEGGWISKYSKFKLDPDNLY